MANFKEVKTLCFVSLHHIKMTQVHHYFCSHFARKLAIVPSQHSKKARGDFWQDINYLQHTKAHTHNNTNTEANNAANKEDRFVCT